jgi:hypothetical protein
VKSGASGELGSGRSKVRLLERLYACRDGGDLRLVILLDTQLEGVCVSGRNLIGIVFLMVRIAVYSSLGMYMYSYLISMYE